ncbi:hypothetical protein [Emticicia sp. BO119]|uniref:hypothetical protein n=1 Tax=Emticicia sp. BO119 TaxID=2757768 RepID=UPI0015F02F18|nr:hypothetical protein [Emticicia sp. BO119]MBA4850366.1 hypothetical protein [Emticicia sp. BO119]
MKKLFVTITLLVSSLLMGCEVNEIKAEYGNGPKTEVPMGIQGSWMFGQFSMTEYWSQDPATYTGNALQLAIAFKFNDNGTYEQYFTSGSTTSTGQTYQQSVTKGTIEVNASARTITTHAYASKYRRTVNGKVVEDRQLNENEIAKDNIYYYTLDTETNGTRVINLTIEGTNSTLPFQKKF